MGNVKLLLKRLDNRIMLYLFQIHNCALEDSVRRAFARGVAPEGLDEIGEKRIIKALAVLEKD